MREEILFLVRLSLFNEFIEEVLVDK
eukprot:gene24445-31833_t